MAFLEECQEWNISNDENLTQYVIDTLGPKCLNQKVAILTEIIYCVIFLTGLLGNMFTCIIIAKDKSMHTATNYYLFSLAVSDLLSLVLGLPFELYQAGTSQLPYTMPTFICKGRAFVSEMTTYASVLTITAFSIERWLAICFPLSVQAFSKLSRAVWIVFVIWTLAFVSAIPVCYFFQINELPLPDWWTSSSMTPAETASVTENGLTIRGTNYCYMNPLDFEIEKTLIAFSFWLFFMMPLLCIVIFYTHIGLTISRAHKERAKDKESQKHDIKQNRSRAVIVRMLIAVVAAFFICWMPFHIQRLASVYVDHELDPVLHNLLTVVYYVSGYFYYSNSAVNPILYNILNKKFRTQFKRMLCGFYDSKYRLSTRQSGISCSLARTAAVPLLYENGQAGNRSLMLKRKSLSSSATESCAFPATFNNNNPDYNASRRVSIGSIALNCVCQNKSSLIVRIMLNGKSQRKLTTNSSII